MKLFFAYASLFFLAADVTTALGRLWTDSTGRYTLDAELVAFSNTAVVLKRADHELVAVPIDKLSDQDRRFLNSQDAGKCTNELSGGEQTWSLRDGSQLVGRIVDYASRDVTIQRRRGRIYVNDRVFENLPEFHQRIIPQIVAQFEGLQRADRRSLEDWLVRQRGAARTFHLNGVRLETQNGDEYAVPFALLSDADLKLIKPRWNDWLMAHRNNDYTALEDRAFLLSSLVAAHQHDQQVQREIALMQLKMQAVAAGVTSLWEVTLYPTAGQIGPPCGS